jgi:hypothetical protein
MNSVLPYCPGILNLANSQVGENPVVGRTLTLHYAESSKDGYQGLADK